jgi:hypothetical protein
MRPLVALALLCVLALGPARADAVAGQAQPAEERGPRWEFVVRIPELARGVADITWTLRGFAPGRLRVCADMDGAERFVQGLAQLPGPGAAGGGKEAALVRDGDCWLAQASATAPTVLRYRIDLEGMARRRGSIDYAERLGGSYIFNDEAVLLRPDPMPHGKPEPPITVEFVLPEGVSLTAPYERLPGPGLRFRLDAAQYDGGDYITVGQVGSLGTIRLPHTVVDLHALKWPRRADDAVLRRWIEAAVGAVDSFYGPLLHERIHVVLVPVPGSSEPGLFGSVMRRGLASVVLYFGADCERFDFAAEWVAVHELFHLGNPLTKTRLSWFVEGFTTYYQDVLRARMGGMTAAAAWGDLWDGARRFCQPAAGASLADESEALRRTYRYTRVYWGGACVAMLVDIAIRERSRGRSSLDDVLRSLRQQSLRRPLGEADVIAALDQAAGQPLVQSLLNERRAIAVREPLARLGIVPSGPDSVTLRDDAPLTLLRKAMF